MKSSATSHLKMAESGTRHIRKNDDDFLQKKVLNGNTLLSSYCQHSRLLIKYMVEKEVSW